MSRKTIILFVLISTLFFLAVPAWAVLMPDSRVVGDVASGWSYTDTTGDVDEQVPQNTVDPRADVTDVTGTLNMTTNTLHFEFITAAAPKQDSGNKYDYFNYHDSYFLGLYFTLPPSYTPPYDPSTNNPFPIANGEASAGMYNWDDFVMGGTEWVSFDNGLAGPSTTTIGATSITIDVPISAAQAQSAFTDGFAFRFEFGTGDAGFIEDSVDYDVNNYGPWLYVVPEPSSILLLGSGLGLLFPIIRRKVK